MAVPLTPDPWIRPPQSVHCFFSFSRCCTVLLVPESFFLTSSVGLLFATLWIVAAIEKACQACAALPIDVKLVHYMHKGDKEFLELERRLKKRAAE